VWKQRKEKARGIQKIILSERGKTSCGRQAVKGYFDRDGRESIIGIQYCKGKYCYFMIICRISDDSQK
jgi:hypothetical protein